MAEKGGESSEPPNTNVFIGDLPTDVSEEDLKQIFGVYGTMSSTRLLPGSGKNAMLVRWASIDDAIWVKENLNGNIPQGLTTPVYVNYNNRAGGKGKGKDGGKGGAGPYGGKDGGKDGWGGSDGGGKDGWGGGDDWGGLWNMAWGMCKGKGKGGKAYFSVDTLKKELTDCGALPGGKWNNESNALYVHGLPRDTTDVDLYHIFATYGAIPGGGCRAMLGDDGGCKGFGFVNFMDPQAAETAIGALNGYQMSDGKTLTVSVKQKKDKGAGKGQEQSAVQSAVEQMGFVDQGFMAQMQQMSALS